MLVALLWKQPLWSLERASKGYGVSTRLESDRRRNFIIESPHSINIAVLAAMRSQAASWRGSGEYAGATPNAMLSNHRNKQIIRRTSGRVFCVAQPAQGDLSIRRDCSMSIKNLCLLV